MNQELIAMARQADITMSSQYGAQWEANTEDLEAFAKMVAAAEREACARVCETLGVHPALNVYAGGPDWYKHGKECAAEIRARGDVK